MKRRILATAAAASIAATVVAVLPSLDTPRKETVTTISDQIEPQISTTARPGPGVLKTEVLLTEEDIAKAQKRANGELASPTSKEAQTKRPEHLKPKHKDGKGTAEDFKAVIEKTRSFATKAKEKPFKLQEPEAANSSNTLSMENVNAFTHTYAVGDTPPAVLAQLCFDYDSTVTDYTLLFDRYTYCARQKISADYWKVDKTTGQKIEHMGTTYANMELFGQNYTDSRSTRLFARLQQGSVDYQWGPIDDWWTAPGVELSLIGQCEELLTTCSTFQGPATMTWGTWDNNTDWFPWNTNSPESGMWGRDKQGAHGLNMQFYTDSEEYSTDEPGVVPSLTPRCDSATYFAPERPHSCVFLEAVPFVAYSTGADSPNREVAQHIQDAFASPNSTYPTSSTAKVFPGEYDGTWTPEGLHRLTDSLHSSVMNANEAEKDDACQKIGDYANTGLPYALQPKEGQDCDEYPFRSTLEGAASDNWDFSVRAVDATQNRSAGGSLVGFYNSDRVLAWDSTLPDSAVTNDTFYVRIN